MGVFSNTNSLLSIAELALPTIYTYIRENIFTCPKLQVILLLAQNYNHPAYIKAGRIIRGKKTLYVMTLSDPISLCIGGIQLCIYENRDSLFFELCRTIMPSHAAPK